MNIKPKTDDAHTLGRVEAAANLPILAYSIAQVCAVTSLARTSVFQLIKDEKLAVVRVGRRTLVPASSLERLLVVSEPLTGASGFPTSEGR